MRLLEKLGFVGPGQRMVYRAIRRSVRGTEAADHLRDRQVLEATAAAVTDHYDQHFGGPITDLIRYILENPEGLIKLIEMIIALFSDDAELPNFAGILPVPNCDECVEDCPHCVAA